jgi:tRNA(adenine34) deaminase
MCGSLENLVQDARLNHHVAIEAAMMAEEAAKLMRDFFRERR